MMRNFALLLIAGAIPAAASAGDWIYRPSTFSHDPATGERVTQFAPIEPVIVPQRSDYQRSGIRQLRSTIRVGNSLDVYNVVDQYGDNIRPYGEWLFPYRPYAVPYDGWGPPFGGVNGNVSRDGFLGGAPNSPYGGGVFDPRFGGSGVRGGRWPDRFDGRGSTDERFNGLYDSRDIPGDDEHYRDIPSRLDLMDDREFFGRPGR